MARQIFTNNRVMILLSVLIFVIGMWFSLKYGNFQWLSRFGAIIICIGIIVINRPAISRIDIKNHIISSETGLSYLDTEHYKKTGEPIPEWVIEDQRSRTAVGWLGPLLCFIGTFTNGFSDLLNIFVF